MSLIDKLIPGVLDTLEELLCLSYIIGGPDDDSAINLHIDNMIKCYNSTKIEYDNLYKIILGPVEFLEKN